MMDENTYNTPPCYESPERPININNVNDSRDIVKELHEINKALNDLNKTMEKIRWELED